jgi:hypothetical protein
MFGIGPNMAHVCEDYSQLPIHYVVNVEKHTINFGNLLRT